MADPNDFADETEAEGEEVGNPKAGQEGVGGLTTQDAEDSYQKAADQHFNDDTNKQKNDTKKGEEKDDNKKENPPTLPQIGSIEDDEITVDD